LRTDREPIADILRTRVRVHPNQCRFAEGRHQLPPPIGRPIVTRQHGEGRRPSEDAAVVDRAVVGAFRRGDPDAVRAFYRAYGRLVYGVAYRVLGRADLAEEATQQAFVRAWQKADRLDLERDPAPWLATITKRIAIDVHRREARRPTSALEYAAPDDPSLVTMPPDVATLDAAWNVRRAIDALAPDEATVVRLQHLEGLTQSEVAAQLGVPLGTVKSRSHRAHAKLATMLGHLRESVA